MDFKDYADKKLVYVWNSLSSKSFKNFCTRFKREIDVLIFLQSNGKKYVTWAISDLKNGIVKLLLFGEAHNAHWKHGERSAICILNAKILPSRPKIVFSNDGISTENHNSSNQSKEVTDSSNMSEYLTYDEDVNLFGFLIFVLFFYERFRV
jgi:hypothetical protein